MRRVIALCAAVGIAVSALAAPAMAARQAPEAGYYGSVERHRRVPDLEHVPAIQAGPGLFKV
jgi:hypothetical protein